METGETILDIAEHSMEAIADAMVSMMSFIKQESAAGIPGWRFQNDLDIIEGKYLGLQRQLNQARRHVATYVNVEACLMNWHVGKRIKEDVLYNQRAEYGKQILKNLSVKLTEKYGQGWGYEKLKHCVRSAYLFSEDEIGYAARTELTPVDPFNTASYRRNPIVAEVFAQLKYMEKRGSGLKKIINTTSMLPTYKDDKKPYFRSSRSFFFTTIPNVNYRMNRTDLEAFADSKVPEPEYRPEDEIIIGKTYPINAETAQEKPPRNMC